MKKKKTSAFSLKSISEKKKHHDQQRQIVKNELKAHEDFSEAQVHKAWSEYIERSKKKGKKIMASILKTDRPKIEGLQITVEMPNETMKKELEREKPRLMGFIKRRLKNSDIHLTIAVNAEATKKYAFTPRERYEKLKTKNPLVEKLKDTFDLDV